MIGTARSLAEQTEAHARRALESHFCLTHPEHVALVQTTNLMTVMRTLAPQERRALIIWLGSLDLA